MENAFLVNKTTLKKILMTKRNLKQPLNIHVSEFVNLKLYVYCGAFVQNDNTNFIIHFLYLKND